MDMISALNSINTTKENLMRNEVGEEIEAEVKAYPPFPITRSLSYHIDVLLLVNELNRRGLSQHGIDNLRHYEFLLNVIPKGRRFAKWSKPEKYDDIQAVMDFLGLTFDKARDIIDLLSTEELTRIKNAKGGQRK